MPPDHRGVWSSRRAGAIHVVVYPTGKEHAWNAGTVDWKTPKDYAGSCTTIMLGLGDASQDLARTAQFQFN